MNNFDHAGWIIVASIASALMGALAHRLFTGNQCASCGIVQLKNEIKVLSGMIRLLCEKTGVKVKEQIEIEETLSD